MNNQNWVNLLPGCFAGMNAPFGVHYYDQQRAIKMLNLAFCQGAKLDDIINETKKYLENYGCN